MGNDLEYFPFFVEDFRTATLAWPAERVGAYWLLLMYQWEHLSVPGDYMDELAAVMHVPETTAKKLWSKLLLKFPKGDGGYQNRRLELVRADVTRAVTGRSRRASDAAKSRWDRCSSNTQASADASPTAQPDAQPERNDGSASSNGNLKSKDLNTNPPLPARRAGLLDECEGILKRLTVIECQSASLFHAAIERSLRAEGWQVEREFPVNDRGDGRRGFVDLVAHAPEKVAFEFDNQSPRQKSIAKLITLAGEGYTPIVICRAAPVAGWWLDRGVHVWGKHAGQAQPVSDVRDADAVQQALETRQRRADLAEDGKSDAEIEEILEQEYLARRGAVL